MDLAVHAPRPEGDPRNFHAHLLATTREVSPEGLGPKTGLDIDTTTRNELGLAPPRQEFQNLRARWAELTNEALREANVEARIDHRSLQAQGIDREPRPRLPWAALKAERRGERSEIAERIRERHNARAATRKARAEAASDRSAEGSPGSVPADRMPQGGPAEDMEARRRRAVQEWLKYRASREQAGGGHANETSPPLSMEEIRQRAVAAWRRLQARGAESQPSAASGRQRDAAHGRGESEQARGPPGLGDDFSG